MSGTAISLPDPQATRALGVRLGRVLRAGDLLVLTGDLGAGKTTFTQGLAEGLGVTGTVTSPTFVLARVHPGGHGPGLLHIDAYRIGDDVEQVADLGVDEALRRDVVVIEWGSQVAPYLVSSWLELHLERAATTDPQAPDSAGERTARVSLVGEGWQERTAELREALHG